MDRKRMLRMAACRAALLIVVLATLWGTGPQWPGLAHGADKAPARRTKHAKPSAVELVPLSIRPVEPLDFGNISFGVGVSGQAVIDASTGEKQVRGSAVDLGGKHGRARFVVRGSPGSRFTISLPERVQLTGPRKGLMLTDFTVYPFPSGIGTIGVAGAATLYLGATLQLDRRLPAGPYERWFRVSVQYE